MVSVGLSRRLDPAFDLDVGELCAPDFGYGRAALAYTAPLGETLDVARSEPKGDDAQKDQPQYGAVSGPYDPPEEPHHLL
jgi:hypothetical protein